MTLALVEFGKAVLKSRTAKGWTLENLAHEALGNQERKSYVSRVEKGRQKLNALTAQKFAKALDLSDAVLDPVLFDASDVDDTPTPTEKAADLLFDETEAIRTRLKLSERMAISLAWEFADANPSDLETALKELRRAFEVVAEQAAGLPTNLDEAVRAVLAEVDRLNAEDDMAGASAALGAALAARRDRLAEEQQAMGTLLGKAIAQAVIQRDVDGAVALELERWRLEGGGFQALRDIWRVWYERGRDKGLRFDLEVAIGLARAFLGEAGAPDSRCVAQNDLAVALSILGERESGTVRLEQAVVAFRAALKERTRDRVPLDWAMTQHNLGEALRIHGERESGTARLEEAVVAYRAALEVYTRDRVPQDWAMTQNDLGTALQILGERESGTARLEEAVVAVRAALEKRTRDRVPLDWAMTQNNLGTALQTLGERKSGTARLEAAVAAYRAAPEEYTR
ncbi:MAG: helix-turn-helix domain-containing protein, partial [Sedimentitalea sp.]